MCTVIYADLILSKRYTPTHLVPVMIVTQDGIVARSLKASVVATDLVADAATGILYPRTVTLHIQDTEIEGMITLEHVDILERIDVLSTAAPVKRQLVKLLVAQPLYFRFLSQTQGSIRLGKRALHLNGESIHELMIINP
jgi:hypothetical protein